MPRADGYVIADEPRPGGLSHLVVNPVWPLFAIMFGGAWLAFPWFVLNAWAMGSAKRRGNLGLGVLGVVGGFALVVALDMGLRLVPEPHQDLSIPYLLMLLTVFKLGLAYALFARQSQSFAVYEYYDGIVRNGIFVVAAGWFLRPRLLEPVFDAAPSIALVLK